MPHSMRVFLLHLRQNRALALGLGLLVALIVIWLSVDRPVKDERRLAERLASGKAVPHHFYVPVYLWRGLTVNLALGAALSAACIVAGRKLAAPPEAAAAAFGLWDKGIIGLAITIAALQGGSRLGHSTWGDEDYTVKTYITDQITEGPEGIYTATPTSWTHALWHNKRPNNHTGYSVMANLVHSTFFKPGDGPRDPIFSEALVRTPAFVFGLLSILALAWMGRVHGVTHGVAMVLIYYAIHPWLTRFGSDARGYAVVLACIPALFAMAGKAVTSGSWRWWLLLALTEAFVFWCYWGVIYVLVALHAGLLVRCLMDPDRSKAERRINLSRWLVSGLLASIIVVQLMAPILPQLISYIKNSVDSQIGGAMDLRWTQDAVTSFLLGTPWHRWSGDAPYCIALSELSPLPMLSLGMVVTVFVLASVVGVIHLWNNPRQRWMLLAVLGAPALFFLHMLVSGIKPYLWYLTLFLPGFLFLLMNALHPLVLGLKSLLTGDARRALTPSLAGAAFFIMAIGIAGNLSSAQRKMFQQHATEPCRESVALTRKVTNPRNPGFGKDSITVGFTMFTEVYDPAMVRFETVDELQELMQKAKSSNRELYVNFGSRAFCEKHFPELFVVFNDPAQFELVAKLPGQFDAGTREVLRMVR